MLQNRKRSHGLPLGEEEAAVVIKKSTPTVLIESPFTDNKHFVTSCMQLQTEGKMTLDFWDSDVARMVYGPFEKAYNVSVAAKDMEMRLRSECTTAFEELKTKLRGKMFSLKLETVPKDDGFMAVSVQFMENFEVKIAHLGMLDTRPEEDKEPECDYCERYDRRLRSRDWDDICHPDSCEELKDLLRVAELYFYQIYSTTLSHEFPSHDCYYDDDRMIDEDRDPLPTNSAPVFDEIYSGVSQWLKQYPRDLVMWGQHGFGPTFRKLNDLREKKFDGLTKLTPEKILVNKLWRALKPFQEMAESGIKSKHYTCGDLILDLLCCESELEEHNDEVSTALYKIMKDREAKLLENIQILAAIYFDPRLNNCNMAYLTTDQKRKVLNYLAQVYNEMKKVEEGAPDAYRCNKEPKWKDNWDWEELGDESLRQELEDLQDALTKLESQPEPIPGVTIAEYWQANPNAQLRRLANVVLAYPVSEIPVRGISTSTPEC